MLRGRCVKSNSEVCKTALFPSDTIMAVSVAITLLPVARSGDLPVLITRSARASSDGLRVIRSADPPSLAPELSLIANA